MKDPIPEGPFGCLMVVATMMVVMFIGCLFSLTGLLQLLEYIQ